MTDKKVKLLDKTYLKWIDLMLTDSDPVEHLNNIISEDIMGYGTTLDEKIHDLKGVKDLANLQRKQSAGINFEYKRTPVFKKMLNQGNTAVFVDEIKLIMQVNEDKMELNVRLSTIMEFQDGEWRVIHWHGSKPEYDSGGTDPWHTEEWQKKNEELQKQVEEKAVELIQKNRELEIEAALERLRSRSMAMKKSEELADLSQELVKQVQALGIDTWFCAFNIYDEDGKGSLEWGSNGQGTFPRYRTPREGVFLRYYEAGQRGETLLINEIDEKECPQHYEYLCSLPGVGDQLLKMKDDGIPFPVSQIDHAAFFKYGYILFITFMSVPEAHDIFKRFANVFEQTYTRFLDLQKAEAQTRESQIELALERVRARAMSMQKSEELSDLVSTVFTELTKLDFALSWCIINIIDEANRTNVVWGANTDAGKPPDSYFMKFEDHRFHHEMMKAYQDRKEKWVFVLEGDEKRNYDNYLFSDTEFKKVSKKVQQEIRSTERYVASFTFCDFGGLQTIGEEPLSEENLNILNRFGKVFDLTYTRFNDLQKAEAQAREAQIETALERVRSRSMGMQKSEELKEVIQIIFEQFALLNIDAEHAGIVVDFEPKKDFHFWVADSQDIPSKITVPYLDLVWDKQFTEAKKKGMDFFTTQLNFEEKNSFYKDLLPHIQGLTKKARDFYLSCPGLSGSTVIEKDIGLYIENFSGTPYSNEENAILMRFGKAFQQTHTRFLDLQKAEAQAREARIETALEKVRSRSIGMQKSEELKEVIQIIHDQLIHLNFEIDAAGFTLDYHQNNDWNIWIANKSESLPSLMFVPYIDHPQFNHYKSAKEKGLDFLANTLSFEEKNSIFNYMFDFMGDYPQEERDEVLRKPGLAISQGFLNNISLWIYNLDAIPYSKEDNNTLMRFAKVFQQTYTRFLDLKKSEEQSREAQIEAVLERVRSRTMAMQQSEEMPEVANNLFLQVKELGFPAWSAGYCIWEKDETSASCSMSSEGVIQKSFSLPTIGEGYDFLTPLKNGEKFYVAELGSEALVAHYNFMRKLPIIGEIIEDFKKKRIELPTFQIFHIVYFKQGYLMFITYEPVPDAHDIFKRLARVFEQTYTRFLDLKHAEAQTRESQIELSLERIRAQVTAMSESSDLLDIVVTMRTEFVSLGHEAHYFWYMRWFPDIYEKAMTSGDGTKIGMIMTLPRHIHGDIKHVADWEKRDEPTVVLAMDVETAVDYVDKMITLGDFKQVDPQAPTLDDIRHIGGLTFIMARTQHGEIGFSLPGNVPEPAKESIDTLARFASVFDLAYSRFEDLKDAEQRNRETQIELALERSRNQSMLMQHSDELNKTSQVFHEQLELLGIDSEFSYLWLPNETKKEHLFWATWHDENKDGKRYSNKQVTYPLDKTEPSIAACYTAWESGERVHINPVTPAEVEDYFATWDELLQGVEKFKPELFPDGIFYVDAYMKYGCFGIMIKRQITEDEKKILNRFTVEFERAYTRFLDLKKSEEQAREAQIEASLERVRSKTMAMHNSQDVGATVVTLFEEVLNLGIDKCIRLGIGILAGYERMETWSANSNPEGKVVLKMGMLDMTIHPMLVGLKKAWKSGKKGYKYDYLGEDVFRYYEALNKEPDYPFHADLNALPENEYHRSFFHPEGILFSFAPEPISEKAAKVLDRFAHVFGQTYRRYRDLQKAETQAREANVETALERVRARALAMQKPEELKEVAKVLRKEMGQLGVEELETCSIYINDIKAEITECWYALKDIRDGKKNLVSDNFGLDLSDTWVGREMLKFYKSPDKQVSIVMTGEPRIEWIRYCEGKSVPFKGYYGEKIPDRTYHLYKFSHGAIGAAAAGDISEESWRLLKRASSVFSLAYSRFNDLTKARHDLHQLKEEMKRAENALTELRSTQSQLIHAEKMASLGELTAGIAHEIQNPLNFVNNFSEVNAELITELSVEIENGDLIEVKAIAEDIAGNEKKIMHHGKRAEAIVKGMLQHSRGSDNEKQKTDINTLADEYLRLSYHGLRAKDKKFNADFILNPDESLPKINVIAQDIGRVLLNLVNNAFYTVSEKAKQNEQGYKPTVKVTTRNLNKNIEISVKDNGNGIPKEVVDKIFQPFFTTKPTGQGTGLGLSMSYDIITKGHQGELKVETKEGEFTEFIIILPK